MSSEKSVEILPGFSQKNEAWAIDTQQALQERAGINATVVCWPHWETGVAEKGWIEEEAKKIVKNTADTPINILAKSVGTMVAMEILKQSAHIDKIILCGIPIEDFQEDSKAHYSALKDIDANRIVIIQNDEDPHGSSDQVKILVDEFNPNINIVTKHGNHHEYPYVEDFIRFLSDKAE